MTVSYCKYIFSFAVSALFLLFGSTVSYGQMTDEQVVSYVKSSLASGKGNEQIGKELVGKGLTQEQAQRIKDMYESSGGVSNAAPVTEKAAVRAPVNRQSHASVVGSTEGGMDAVVQEMVAQKDGNGVMLFGHNIFHGRNLTFEPNENAATPADYKLGPGDRLQIDIWGFSEASISQTITPEGRIFISQIGPIQLSGLTIAEASAKIRGLLSSKYSGLGAGSASVSVTLTQIRTIRVNVMGEVTTPGTYRLSSFATVFNAIYRAGGVTANGSLRCIKVVRAGEQIATVDVYGYLFSGKSDSDMALCEGDVVIVPPYVRQVTVTGKVKRPMTYELVEGESLSSLIGYAGGLAGDAYREDFRVVRHTDSERKVFTVKKADAGDFYMEDGDLVTVGASPDRYANRVEVRGCVFRPGIYELGGEIATVRQLLGRAGGPMEDAFLPRALLLREKDDLGLQTLSFDLGALLKGDAEDILLRKNDVLIVSGIHELQDRGTLRISGYVASPGEFPFADSTTVEDLILQAGGLLDGASTARVDIFRRINDRVGTKPADTIGRTYSFPLKDGLASDGGASFVLMPYDVVFIRKSPSYSVQKYVTVDGEVAFPGQYVLLSEGERLSELISRCGGLTKYAYLQGGRLIRKSSDENDYLNGAIRRVINKAVSRDSISTGSITFGDYSVALSLDRALERPGSSEDIVLEEGDRIIIPKFVNTVRIEGEVMFPAALLYYKGLSAKQFINKAGGFTKNAKRSRVFVVYPDGHARRLGAGGTDIEPGSVIIVPSKRKSEKMSTAELLATASTATSLVTMLATVGNMVSSFVK